MDLHREIGASLLVIIVLCYQNIEDFTNTNFWFYINFLSYFRQFQTTGWVWDLLELTGNFKFVLKTFLIGDASWNKEILDTAGTSRLKLGLKDDSFKKTKQLTEFFIWFRFGDINHRYQHHQNYNFKVHFDWAAY